MHKILSLIVSILFTFLISCSSDTEKPQSDIPVQDTVKQDTIPVFSLNYPEIKYQKVHISDVNTLNQIKNKYRNDPNISYRTYVRTIETLNRKDLGFFRIGQDVVIPDTIIDDMRAYSIFPDDYPGAKNIEKLIVVCNKMQCYACYEYGNLVRFAAANTGKERTPTFPGRYALVWKQRLRTSSLDSTWKMPYTFNFHQFAGNAMHQFSMPGRPVSHSCIRQFNDDAMWIFNWGKGAKYDEKGQAIPLTGTPLIILNTFDFTIPEGGPWLDLVSNKCYYVEIPENPMEVEEALIPYQQIPKSSRGMLPNVQRYKDAEKILRERGVIREGVTLTESVDFNKLRQERAARREKEKLEKERLEKEKLEKETLENNSNENINQ